MKKEETEVKADGFNLYRARVALSFLGHMAACYASDRANFPPDDFGFGLSTILYYIEEEIAAAEEEIERKVAETENKNGNA